MKTLINGAISAAGFRSHDTTSNSLTHARHHKIIPIDAETPKAGFGLYSNSATTPTGKIAASKPRDIYGITQGMTNKEQCHGKNS